LLKKAFNVYSEQSKADIREIVLWYHFQQEGLENEFLENLEIAFTNLESNPNKYQVYLRKVRGVVLKRFPYRIIYKIEKNIILIVGVFHTSRNPEIIRKRTR